MVFPMKKKRKSALRAGLGRQKSPWISQKKHTKKTPCFWKKSALRALFCIFRALRAPKYIFLRKKGPFGPLFCIFPGPAGHFLTFCGKRDPSGPFLYFFYPCGAFPCFLCSLLSLLKGNCSKAKGDPWFHEKKMVR